MSYVGLQHILITEDNNILQMCWEYKVKDHKLKFNITKNTHLLYMI
jgi:hypothetical protein